MLAKFVAVCLQSSSAKVENYCLFSSNTWWWEKNIIFPYYAFIGYYWKFVCFLCPLLTFATTAFFDISAIAFSFIRFLWMTFQYVIFQSNWVTDWKNNKKKKASFWYIQTYKDNTWKTIYFTSLLGSIASLLLQAEAGSHIQSYKISFLWVSCRNVMLISASLFENERPL